MIFQAEWHLFCAAQPHTKTKNVSGGCDGVMDVRPAASDVSGATVVRHGALFFSLSCAGYAQ